MLLHLAEQIHVAAVILRFRIQLDLELRRVRLHVECERFAQDEFLEGRIVGLNGQAIFPCMLNLLAVQFMTCTRLRRAALGFAIDRPFAVGIGALKNSRLETKRGAACFGISSPAPSIAKHMRRMRSLRFTQHRFRRSSVQRSRISSGEMCHCAEHQFEEFADGDQGGEDSASPSPSPSAR